MYEYEEVRIKMDLIQKNLLEQVAGLHEIPEGAYNIRANGTKLGRNTTANIDIVTKTDKDGIDIIIKPGSKNYGSARGGRHCRPGRRYKTAPRFNDAGAV